MRFIGLLIISILLVMFSALIWLGLIMGGVFFKKKISKMDAEKWDHYFENMTVKDYIIRGSSIYAASLCLSASIGYYIFRLFSYNHPLFLSSTIVILGGIQAYFQVYKNKDGLINKVKKLAAIE